MMNVVKLTTTYKHCEEALLCPEAGARGLSGEDAPCWMLDPDYDGQYFRAGRVFFPRTVAWERIKNALHAEFEDSIRGHLSGDTGEPFVIGENDRMAGKVIDDWGNELMIVDTRKEVV